MITLALELSTRRGSAALLADGRPLAERSWDERAGRGQPLFGHVAELCREAGVELDAVGLFAPGRGPGAYSGLRIAMTAARAYALPGAREVFAVSSGEALAAEIARETGARRIAVVGDARRDTLWLGLFEREADRLAVRQPWSIVRPAELAGRLTADTLCVSSDGARLAPALAPGAPGEWIAEDRFPEARRVGLLAWENKMLGLPSEPLAPIYLHPSVAPRPNT